MILKYRPQNRWIFFKRDCGYLSLNFNYMANQGDRELQNAVFRDLFMAALWNNYQL